MPSIAELNALAEDMQRQRDEEYFRNHPWEKPTTIVADMFGDVRDNPMVRAARELQFDRAVASSIEVNYTGPAKEADTVAINAGLAADVADRYGKVDAAAYNAWYDAAKAKADAAIAAKAAEHDAITAQLEAIAARSESNAKIAKEIAKKVNGE